jgi:CheY-like chemotaxis protein
VLIDPSQLEQILMNLVVNARDAIAGDGKIIIRIGATEDHTTLEVADTGCGMAPDVAARVFEPYFTTKELGKGTGLGLATVHGIVQRVGGAISVESQLGTGTTFRIALPKTDLMPEASRVVSAVVASGKVLLVDDDDQLRRVTERMLRVAGYHVVSAACGADALSAARRESFDILLTDMVMPGMSGRDLARDLLAEHPQMRVVYMSGYSATPPADWQFLAKPFDRHLLLSKMGELTPALSARVASGTGTGS